VHVARMGEINIKYYSVNFKRINRLVDLGIHGKMILK
jgi:hypothetical protein